MGRRGRGWKWVLGPRTQAIQGHGLSLRSPPGGETRCGTSAAGGGAGSGLRPWAGPEPPENPNGGAVGVAHGRGRGPAGAHPLVDGVRLAQRALGGWNAVGDAPVALAQTPQLAADLLRAKAPAQARPPPSSLRLPARRAATRSLPPRSGAPALLCWVSRSLLESSCGAWPETPPSALRAALIQRPWVPSASLGITTPISL